ncbi:uncharacterized protein J3D65DRAFT_322275 [Phyllosticta citribraziliensis]|uniref:Uncharacterized protein n=1 Tax=Phyllosticta citribraziliensis TaxID=989973 RepID=A0ABR1LUC0_9PEZI
MAHLLTRPSRDAHTTAVNLQSSRQSIPTTEERYLQLSKQAKTVAEVERLENAWLTFTAHRARCETSGTNGINSEEDDVVKAEEEIKAEPGTPETRETPKIDSSLFRTGASEDDPVCIDSDNDGETTTRLDEPSSSSASSGSHSSLSNTLTNAATFSSSRSFSSKSAQPATTSSVDAMDGLRTGDGRFKKSTRRRPVVLDTDDDESMTPSDNSRTP